MPLINVASYQSLVGIKNQQTTKSIFYNHKNFIMLKTRQTVRFKNLGILTIIAVYVVILAGGIVRASGAGMGCPDWPTCFGQWIPPTDKSQLPVDYHEIYANRGYKNTDFNLTKTWTEYINRLIGVTVGLLIFFTAWSAKIYLKTDKSIFYLALSAFFLVGFQGWLGSVVVESNLKPFLVTIHMLVALFIVALLIYAVAKSQLAHIAFGLSSRVHSISKVAIGLTLIQIAMGTQVREAVDFIAHTHNNIAREYWIDNLPIIFYIHRSFSVLILFSNLWITWNICIAVDKSKLMLCCAYFLIGTTIVEIIAGISLDRLGFVPIAQPIHLLMASLMFGIQIFIYICLRIQKRPISY